MLGIIHPQLKTNRAAAHLQRLQELLALYRTSEPYTITTHDEPEQGIHIYRFTWKPGSGEIPLLLGEYFFNLRSALDQLAWQLALMGPAREPSRKTAFPIHDDTSAESERRFAKLTKDIRADAIELIRELQPYQRGDAFKSHPLWQLNALCNLDKHCTMVIHADSVNIATSGPPDVFFQMRHFDDGVYCGTDLIIPLAAKDKVQFKPQFVETIFGRPIDEPGESLEVREAEIVEIHRFVRDEVLPRFAPFLRGAS